MKRSSAAPLLSQSRRKSSTPHYQTFPTAPPTSRGKPPSSHESTRSQDNNDSSHDADGSHEESPLPIKQLLVLAVIALAEQTALNSISPYLPDMAAHFPEVQAGQVGFYVGIIASSFALAQFTTNYFWGWLSDHIGRKPIILSGTFLTAVGFCMFGFCTKLWQAVAVQVFIGLMNGNQGVISTCLGEITDRSNQSKAFTYLPVIYGIGGITGPAIGGLLVGKTPIKRYPYLSPNLLGAALLLVTVVVTALLMEESLEAVRDLPPLGKRVQNLFTWMWQFAGGSHRPTYARANADSPDDSDSATMTDEEDNDDHENHARPTFMRNMSTKLQKSEIFNRDVILLFTTFLIFQLANISYNSLYPIFGQEAPPTGRDLSPEEIGLSLAFAGAFTIVFQVGIYGKIRDKLGNKMSYRLSLFLFALAFFMMPWVGYKDSVGHPGDGKGKILLWVELGVVLVIKTIAAVGGLTSALLLITNSAPNHHTLGTLNGAAQTLSAAGRAVGPFISGAIFSASTQLRPKGEALAFGLFGGIAFVGFVASWWIRGEGLEAEGWGEDEDRGQDEEL